MEAILDTIRRYRTVDGERLTVARTETSPLAAVDPTRLCVEVAADAEAHLVLLHTQAQAASVEVVLAEGARFVLTELFVGGARADVHVRQAAGSGCRMTAVQLSAADLTAVFDLEGRGAASEFGGAFLAAGEERCTVSLRTNHRSSECRSESSVKGVAGGSAFGEFRGLVYVAPDAQHTDARQQSRNILLSESARIVTEPQLEIYADDVKCSHGATVGQMDDEAVFYMRQRGLSESQARRLQIEGFVGDIVRRCGIEPLCDAQAAAVAAKMERM